MSRADFSSRSSAWKAPNFSATGGQAGIFHRQVAELALSADDRGIRSIRPISS